ncbi:MAG: chemotaxis protein CheW [Planctomycetota bacterium]
MADLPTTPPDPVVQRKNSAQFVGFQLGGQEYAFPIEQIREIVIIDNVTQVPQVPDFVEGVTNLRGAIIPIINLRRLLDLPPKAADAETRTIVVNVRDRTMGCTVDMVSQVIRILDSEIQDAPATITADGADYISGFAKQDERLLVLLDIERLLDPEKIQTLTSSTPPASP